MEWYKNLMIGKKFIVAFLIMILFIVAVGLLGIRSTKEIHSYVQDMVAVRIPAMDYLIQADRDLQQLLVAERSMMFRETDPALFSKLAGDYDENLSQSKERWEKYKLLASTDEEKQVFASYESARADWQAVSQRIVDNRKSGDEAARQSSRELSLGQAS